jgi:hypothetical protein
MRVPGTGIGQLGDGGATLFDHVCSGGGSGVR